MQIWYESFKKEVLEANGRPVLVAVYQNGNNIHQKVATIIKKLALDQGKDFKTVKIDPPPAESEISLPENHLYLYLNGRLIEHFFLGLDESAIINSVLKCV